MKNIFGLSMMIFSDLSLKLPVLPADEYNPLKGVVGPEVGEQFDSSTCSNFQKILTIIKNLAKKILHHSPFDRIPDEEGKELEISEGVLKDSALSQLIDQLGYKPPRNLELRNRQIEILQEIEKEGEASYSPDVFEGAKQLIQKEGSEFTLSSLSNQEKLALSTIRFIEISAHFQNCFDGKEKIIQQYNDYGIDLLSAYILEVLSKSLFKLPEEVTDGRTIQFPVQSGDNKLQIVSYEIKRHHSGKAEDDIPYYILKPLSNHDKEGSLAPTYLVIPGTDFELFDADGNPRKLSLSSILADLISEEGMAHKGLDYSLNNISNKLNDIKRPICIGGHSLGGEYAQYLSVQLAKKELPVKAYAFNAPGVDRKTKEDYDDLDKEVKPPIFAFDMRGDFIPNAGAHLIGQHYRVEQGSSFDLGLNHCMVNLNKRHKLQKISIECERNKFSRKVAHELKKYVVSPLTKLFVRAVRRLGNGPNDFFQNLNRAIPNWVSYYFD